MRWLAITLVVCGCGIVTNPDRRDLPDGGAGGEAGEGGASDGGGGAGGEGATNDNAGGDAGAGGR